jgi:hypothetical protein
MTFGGPDANSFVNTSTNWLRDSTGSFDAQVGSSVVVFGRFILATGSGGGNGASWPDVWPDPGSVAAGATYGLWVSDPKVTLTSMSGHIYAPVPEPESYAMFLVGLGLMGAIARKRKSTTNSV